MKTNNFDRCRLVEISHEWQVAYGTGQSGRQMLCPECGSSNIHRADIRGPGRGRGPSRAGRGRGSPARGPRFTE